MSSFYDHLLEVIKTSPNYVSEDGTLLKNQLYNDATKNNPELIRLIYSDETLRERFFVRVDDIVVFKSMEFGWIINNKQFLPDSYTRFLNHIGLADTEDNPLYKNKDIVLIFPHKDCILEGGQTSEEQRRTERFYNVILSPKEKDVLLAPKAFTKATKYFPGGSEAVTTFDKKSNMLIKGNNLLALYSLKKVYEGEIKLVYIDVPYNTGNDSFQYNDRFNHSTWLTFMKNRLEVARKLLSKDGTIAISVDNYELGYLLVLLDEIFGKENRKNIITVRRASATGSKVINPGVVNVVEYVVIYSRDTTYWKPNRVFAAKDFDFRYNTYIKNYEEGYEHWEFEPLLEAFAHSLGCKKTNLKKRCGEQYDTLLNHFVLNNASRIVQFVSLDDNQISSAAAELKKMSKENPNKIYYLERPGKKDYYLIDGHLILFAEDRMTEIDGVRTFSQPLTDIWDDVLPNDLHNEGGVSFRKGKKPEKLMSRLVELCTNEGDIVLDFFAGSGTTGAVCHKMKRQYILCEQLDYIETTTRQRLINVIDGEGRGISKQSQWTGGGSLLYFELASFNQKYVDLINEASTDEDLISIYDSLKDNLFNNAQLDLSKLYEGKRFFSELSFDEKADALLNHLLEMNVIYVNKSEVDDPDMGLSERDRQFTKSFYGE